ncbi:murein biosynthesis integral membrane protein MurJ [Patescibacteria group bacterium]|nr:murein biosynthesis integral membrane protein MurJ [Patescibacteria group bacterium]MBU2579793.1 murein biosynthesis integral membrane protein MurJ [Patescibacteria group bacterium]
MIKRFFNNQSKTIFSAAVVLGAASFVSRFLGLIRDKILAGMFGAGGELDAYYAAFRIPDLIYSLLVLGAVSAGFIPVFVNYLNQDKKTQDTNHWHLANSVLNLMALSLMAACFLLAIFAPWIMKLVAPGFSAEQLSLASQLTRIMFLSPFFMGLSAIFGGILQSFRRFLAYAMAPIAYNLGIIFGALVLTNYFGLLGLAYGVALGSFFHLAIQIPTAFLCGFRWRPVFDFRFDGVRRIFKLMPARVLSLGLSQITIWIMTAFASLLTVGSIAIYSLTLNIWSFPLGVFGVSFVVAAFPKLSETAQKNDLEGFIKTFYSAVRQILFFILPSSALFIVLRTHLVSIILQGGRFGPQETALAAETLAYFSIALFAEALVLLFLRCYFAWEDSKTPFLIGFAAMAARLSAAWVLSYSLGVAGLALGYAIGSIFYLILLAVFFRAKLRKKFGAGVNLNGKDVLISGIKMVSASFLAALASWLFLRSFGEIICHKGVFEICCQGGMAGIIGVLSYFFFAWVFRLSELDLFVKALSRRLPWKKISWFGIGSGRE